jgi:hypothetical protein
LLHLIAALHDQWDRRDKRELSEASDTLFNLFGTGLVNGAVVNDGIGTSAGRDKANE